MDSNKSPASNQLAASSPTRRPALRYAAGVLAAGAIIGGVAATALGATAATPSTNSSGSTSSSSSAAAPAAGTQGTAPGQGQRPPLDRSATPVRSDEKAVSADVAAKLKAAALKAVPGGTVYRVETDADGATYEAHMVKADGTTEVTVKFDASFTVTGIENGHGAGPAGAPGGPGTPPSGQTPNGAQSPGA